MAKFKKYLIVLFGVIIICASFFFKISLADDEEDDDEGGRKSKTETVTTYIKLPDQFIKKIITTTVYDSDGDGVFDPDDETPNLHNIFLVKDDNFNGITDEYENEK